jgi:hypothetical protein
MNEVEMLQAVIARQRMQIDAMSQIVRFCWTCVRDGYDVDGGELQDRLIGVGLLEEGEVTEEDCQDDEGLSPGDRMCQWTEMGRAALGVEP